MKTTNWNFTEILKDIASDEEFLIKFWKSNIYGFIELDPPWHWYALSECSLLFLPNYEEQLQQ